MNPERNSFSRLLTLVPNTCTLYANMETLAFVELLCLAVVANNKRKIKKRKPRRYWVHPYHLNRPIEGVFHQSYPKIRFHPDKFFEYYRMSVNSFDELKCLVQGRICKKTVLREPIGVEERLTVTIRYLATGLNFTALSHDFRIAKQTIRVIVEETCEAIWDILQQREMAPPSAEEWKNISRQFLRKTQFPNCCGAVDGKHIRLRCPINSGSNFYNYKHYHSIVLLAVADAEYRFTAINVGSYGREGDSTILRQSTFGKMLYDNQLNIPNPEKLPNADNNDLLPYVFLGDEAFALHKHVLRPYPRQRLTTPKRVFNYRLSRARRYIECAFGIFTNKWRVFHSPIILQPDFAVKVTKAACVLHNFVRARDGYNFEDTMSYSFGSVDEDQTDFGRNCYTQNAVTIREKFTEYFVSPHGELSWQYRRAEM